MAVIMLLGGSSAVEELGQAILGVRASHVVPLDGGIPEVELSLSTVNYFIELSLEGV